MHFWRFVCGRLNQTDAVSQELTFGGATVTWRRGGASPEVWFAGIDYSTNGTDWISLGAGARIPNGWQLTGVSVPANAIIRSLGLVSSDDSSWLLETVIPQSPLTILRDDAGYQRTQAATALLCPDLIAGCEDLTQRAQRFAEKRRGFFFSALKWVSLGLQLRRAVSLRFNGARLNCMVTAKSVEGWAV